MMLLLNLLRETEKPVTLFNIKKAYLKSKSPSCGVGKIYHSKNLVTGNGVCATILLKKNIELISILSYSKEFAWIIQNK